MDGIRRGAIVSRLEKGRNEDIRRIMNMQELVNENENFKITFNTSGDIYGKS